MKILNFFNALDTSASALSAQKLRMDVIAQNIANANTTRGPNGKPYRKKFVVFEENKNNNINLSGNGRKFEGAGVKVSRIIEDKGPLRAVHDPNHPDADENGMVYLPNVDTVKEMIDMISATRAYESNITVINSIKHTAMKALEIGR